MHLTMSLEELEGTLELVITIAFVGRWDEFEVSGASSRFSPSGG